MLMRNNIFLIGISNYLFLIRNFHLLSEFCEEILINVPAQYHSTTMFKYLARENSRS